MVLSTQNVSPNIHGYADQKRDALSWTGQFFLVAEHRRSTAMHHHVNNNVIYIVRRPEWPPM